MISLLLVAEEVTVGGKSNVFAVWCNNNYLVLGFSGTREMAIDFRRKATHSRKRGGTQLQLRTNNWTSQVTGYKKKPGQVVFSEKVVVAVAVLCCAVYLSIYLWMAFWLTLFVFWPKKYIYIYIYSVNNYLPKRLTTLSALATKSRGI